MDVWIDDKLSFSTHIKHLLKKLKALLGIYYRKESCLSILVRKGLVQTTFLPVLDYGDILYINAASSVLHSLATVHHQLCLQNPLLPCCVPCFHGPHSVSDDRRIGFSSSIRSYWVNCPHTCAVSYLLPTVDTTPTPHVYLDFLYPESPLNWVKRPSPMLPHAHGIIFKAPCSFRGIFL